MKKDPQFRRNKITFGLGTIGRDMLYTLVSMYLIVYITEAVGVSNSQLLSITAIIMGARIFDAVNDPFMGLIVDNTKSRWGKYKPWIAIGAPASAVLSLFLFADLGLTGSLYIVFFGIIYILWGIAWTTNDIAYWSMMPSLSYDQKEREELGSFTRIAANIGLFAVVAAILPLTSMLGEVFGGLRNGYFALSIIICIIMLGGQALTLLGVKQPPVLGGQDDSKTDIRGMVRALVKNDQLLYTGIAMALFMIGYITTTSFGVYYFKYAYGNEGMYPIFAVVLGISQISALAVFPLFSKHFSRGQLHTGAMILIMVAYVLFFFTPMNMIFIGISGIMLFSGQAFIQLLMLVYLADTIEYGHWKLGKRNGSITLAIQPFVYKMGGAVGSGILGVTLVISGINNIPEGGTASTGSITIMKLAMMVLPLLLVLASYIIHRSKYILDEKKYAEVVADLVLREKA